MGAEQSSTTLNEKDLPSLDERLSNHPILQHWLADAPLVPGSGRFMKTFRIRQKKDPACVAVLKTGWVDANDDEELLSSRARELQRLQKAVAGQSHVAPFIAWFSSPHHNNHHYRLPHSITAVYLLRPHFYTTLSDRLASRPFLQPAEKLFLSSQLLQALQALHAAGVVHGFITTSNLAVTATGWLVLTDLATAVKEVVHMADDDPSDFLYYFAQNNSNQDKTTAGSNNNTISSGGGGGGQERCYLAPERFGRRDTISQAAAGINDQDKKEKEESEQQPQQQQQEKQHASSSLSSPLTPAMDIFSAGCVLTEVFLNGETCLELGDLLEYRANTGGQLTPSLQQKLYKVESSAVRAACKHMLQLDPHQRLSAAAYWERWNKTEPFPQSFSLLTGLVEQVTTTLQVDARLAYAAAAYEKVVWETVGVRDVAGQAYFAQVLGFPSSNDGGDDEKHRRPYSGSTYRKSDKPVGSTEPLSDADTILAETEALLAQLESLQLDQEIIDTSTAPPPPAASQPEEKRDEALPQTEERSPMSKNSLMIYLQVITATVRHVQRPASKLVALQLLKRLAKYASDEARLQRIVPVTISLLQDQDALVRACAVQVLTYTLSIVQSFPPSDSQLFPQYIFKRVTHLISDPSLVARLAFARSIAVLAETAQRFLDISHAIRLYEAVGSSSGAGSGPKTPEESATIAGKETENTVFGDDVHKLLDAVSRSSSRLSLTENNIDASADPPKSEASSTAIGGRTLISSTYNVELAGLHETVSRWVVQLTTDQSNHSSLSKRAVLHDLGRLCAFFGLEGVMGFILPQILAFLNERKDWELRATLFEQMPSVCYIIGRAATEEFVLPCVEIGLVDNEEQVISRALQCLAELVQLGLLSRFAIIGNTSSTDTTRTANSGLLSKYGVLLLHPSEDIRNSAIKAFAAMCEAIGPLDVKVYIIPCLSPLFRFQPAARSLTSFEGMARSIACPWSRDRLTRELDLVSSSVQGLPQTPGTWTSIGISLMEETTTKIAETPDRSDGVEDFSGTAEPQVERFRDYLLMLLKHTASFSSQERQLSMVQSSQISNGIEGSVKLAQHIMFPKQNGREQKGVVPRWYASLRDEVESNDFDVSEDSAIRSVSSLGQVFGLSIMGPATGANEIVVDASDEVEGKFESSKDVLHSKESLNIEAAFAGRWGPETTIDPEIVDTCLLVTKLKAMQVPPLPPQLGAEIPLRRSIPVKDPSSAKSWKPKMNAMMATSSHVSGHTSPVVRLAVSVDQNFFVSGSHDGTCRVWEIPQIEESPGILESCTTYTGHSDKLATRVNDIAMLEGSHSIVSGASDGSVHVWRVDMIAATSSNSTLRGESSRVVGTSAIRKADPKEGEILAVSHFNSPSASVITFATQKGCVHSWDLRCGQEPFVLRHSASLGNLTAMALGSDRNWFVSGTSNGYIALWDIRFQQPLKLWRHSRGALISRLATSYILPPQHWGTNDQSYGARPFIFVASGPNECGMFDVLNGNCQGCFRVVEGDSRNLNAHVVEPPHLEEFRIAPLLEGNIVKSSQPVTPSSSFPSSNALNCMVGSVGTGDQSYLITGGSDSSIRFWDFSLPSKCFVVSGQSAVQPRPSYERIDFDGNRRLMLCRESASLGLRDSNSMPRKLFRGLKKPEHFHSDSVEDLKVIDNSSLISCSRDCTVKVWR